MYDEETNTPAIARNSNLNEELGQVWEHVGVAIRGLRMQYVGVAIRGLKMQYLMVLSCRAKVVTQRSE